MASKLTPMLFVTANVGSIFDEPKRMLTAWVNEFLKTVKRLQPRFVALHCQEIGGKNYEGSMKYVDDFVRMLMASEELMHFDRIRVYLDEDFASSERFTALGNLYFIHETIKTAYIWDFQARTYVPCYGKEVHSGNIEDVPSKEKKKFPPEFFPECKWSRKGYLRTRWNINGTLFDLLNIHLFHDASNFLAIEAFPSIYSNYRQRALQYVLDRLKNGEYDYLPFFVFGDFNFRLDTQGVVKRLTNKSVPLHVMSNKNGEISKIVYRDQNNDNKIILTVGKKEFDHHDQHESFYAERGKLLKEFDRELDPFEDQLIEYPITFAPSYPFCEEMSSATSYMKTRCPAWCDRILLSKSAKALVNELLNDKNNSSSVQYNVIGDHVCMGDHKPIYLFFLMSGDAGKSLLPGAKYANSTKTGLAGANLPEVQVKAVHHQVELVPSPHAVTNGRKSRKGLSCLCRRRKWPQSASSNKTKNNNNALPGDSGPSRCAHSLDPGGKFVEHAADSLLEPSLSLTSDSPSGGRSGCCIPASSRTFSSSRSCHIL